jgi:hypothetical protein
VDLTVDKSVFYLAVTIRGYAYENHLGLYRIEHLTVIGEAFAHSRLLAEALRSLGNEIAEAYEVYEIGELKKMSEVITSDAAASDNGKSCFFL